MEMRQIDAFVLVNASDLGASESGGCKWVKMVQLVPTQDL